MANGWHFTARIPSMGDNSDGISTTYFVGIEDQAEAMKALSDILESGVSFELGCNKLSHDAETEHGLIREIANYSPPTK